MPSNQKSKSRSHHHATAQNPAVLTPEVREKIQRYEQEMEDIREKHKLAQKYLLQDVMDNKDKARLRTLSERVRSLRETGDEKELFRRAGKKAAVTRQIHELESEIEKLKKSIE